jgi:DNA-binding CsgD family transcriptional regulator
MLDVTARRPAVTLSPRELEVLELLRGGLTPKEIAGLMQLSIWTVRDHIESAKGRFGARTTPQLVAFFARMRDRPRTSRAGAPPSD